MRSHLRLRWTGQNWTRLDQLGVIGKTAQVLMHSGRSFGQRRDMTGVHMQ